MSILLQQNDLQALSIESINSLLSALRIASVNLQNFSREQRLELQALENQLRSEFDTRRWDAEVNARRSQII